ncbi:hypothetical protein G7072_19365 [Nocardioides sp. HDW12B]|uniref:TY-Chap domain-containing protein n=1 Tax=Nocardioides sp. HDW12B TaxID=2714939 RepID=UPI00140B5F52|nr:hypothetical protein [Nocardioides sp. HDW12B]QIK68209.1 hypothetical protein G7072_19365 [Nocardioides sp. HDW12B]
MTTVPGAEDFVTTLAPRLEAELGRLVDGGFVQASSPPMWTHRSSFLVVIRSSREVPAGVQAIRFDDTLVLTTSGDRSFGGPLDLGPLDGAFRSAGWWVEHPSINRRHEYRAEVPWSERDRAAALMARTLALLGAADASGVDVETYPEG